MSTFDDVHQRDELGPYAYAEGALGIPMSYGYGSAMPPLKTGSGPCKQMAIANIGLC